MKGLYFVLTLLLLVDEAMQVLLIIRTFRVYFKSNLNFPNIILRNPKF